MPDQDKDMDKTAVAARFSDAAQRYEQAAHVQKAAAARFDAWLARQIAAEPASIVEIGCGTGLLTRLLHRRYPRARLHATDLAPAMVAACRAGLADASNLAFSVCDGRDARFDPAPDWVVSAMCFQWFDPLRDVLAHHLASSGVLAFSIVLDGSFSAWRAAHERAGLEPGLLACPNYEQLLRICEGLGASRVVSERVTINEWHANGLSFAHSLRAIGADRPRPGHAPVSLKPVLRQLAQGFDADYEIGFFLIEK
jgi:malonyl-CoA O-methyltransferase